MYVFDFVCRTFNSRIMRQDAGQETDTENSEQQTALRASLPFRRTHVFAVGDGRGGFDDGRSFIWCVENLIFSPRPSADSDLRSANAHVIVCNLGSAVDPHWVFTTITLSPSDQTVLTSCPSVMLVKVAQRRHCWLCSQVISAVVYGWRRCSGHWMDNYSFLMSASAGVNWIKGQVGQMLQLLNWLK